MDSPLSPRDIQVRIRSGESVDDVVASSGMDPDRVERFAAPVLAEREHVALIALGSSVRRMGESSGHRPLRAVVAERLLGQGVDADGVSWDAWKRDDGQWQLSADYELRDEARHAEFRYDPQGRFSTAEDDDARWLAGERPSPLAAAVDRDDELALVRATSEPSAETDEADDDAGPDAEDDADEGSDEDTDALVEAVAEELGAVLRAVPPVELSEEELDALVAADPESDDADGSTDLHALGDRHDQQEEPPTDEADADADDTLVVPRDEAAEPTIAVVRHLTRVTVEVDDTVGVAGGGTAADEARSALDTLYDMLGGDGYAEESPRVYAGLSDAAAVPEVDEHEFEPAADVLVPAEPSEPDEDADEPDDPAPTAAQDDEEPAATEPDALGRVTAATPVEEPVEPGVASADEAAAADESPVDEPLIPSPGASRKPGRRKRASVPSWDEIMFGGPKPG